MDTLEETLKRLIASYGEAEILITLGQIKRNQIFPLPVVPKFEYDTVSCAPSIEFIRYVLADTYEVDPATVDETTTIDSLGMLDSLDYVEFVMQLEDEFAIEIDDSDAERLFTKPLSDVAEYLKKRITRDA